MGLQDAITVGTFGGSIALIVWTLYAIGREIGARAPADRPSRAVRDRWVQVLLLLAEPLADALDAYRKRSRSPVLGRLLGHYELQIRSAGLADTLRATELVSMIPIAGAFGFFLGIVVYAMLPIRALIALFVLGGLALPVIWLRDQARRRQDEISRALPFAIDLLTLMTEAGLDFTIALQRISQKLGANALGQEFAITQQEIRMGRNRSEAVRNLAERVNLIDMRALCSAITQADELGSGFGPTLRVQAEQIRISRAQEIEKRALEAPVKILFPLVVFIFPTTFVIIFGPVFLSYLR